MSLKSDFVTDLRAVPEGIDGLLSAAIPTPPTGLTQPTTEAEATIMQGILAYYLLQVFAVFAGLTPVELALRIGQHSAPVEAMCLAGLRYLDASSVHNDFKIIEPIDGQSYTPGTLRISCQITNGTISVLQAIFTSETITQTLDLKQADGYYQGYIDLDTAANYTLTIAGLFTKTDGTTETITHALTITITEDSATNPLPPGGSDDTALTTAKAATEQTYQAFVRTVSATRDRTTLIAAYQAWKKALQAYLATAKAAISSPTALNEYAGAFETWFPKISTEIQTYTEYTTDQQSLLTMAAGVQSIVTAIQQTVASVS